MKTKRKLSYELTWDEKKYLRQIASFYGCRVRFIRKHGGFYHGEFIEVGRGNTLSEILSIFFHELGHFKNWKTGKFAVYHDPKSKILKQIPDLWKRVRYALRAEIYTEKVGRELQREWFPGIRYHAFYKRNAVSFYFLLGYDLKSWLR